MTATRPAVERDGHEPLFHSRYEPRWGAGWRWVALGVTWVVVVLAGSWLVHSSETARRQALQQGFTARAQTGAGFVGSFSRDVLSREKVLARANFAGSVSPAHLARLAQDNDFQAAVVLDGRGDLLAAYPSDPALVGTEIGDHYAHLRGALAGVPSVSGVVPSAVRREPVVAFAVPFESATGQRRVFSGAYAVSATPLRSYLLNETGTIPDAAYLVDANGAVVASGRAGPVQSGMLAKIDPRLAAAVAQGGAQTIGAGASARRVATIPVAGTPWRLVFTARTQVLYQPVTGWSVWGARVVLIALALAGLIVIGLLQRALRQRRRLAEEHSRLRILAQVVESAGEAISGRDLEGRFMSWNPAAERLFGWPAAEVIGHGLEHPMHGDQGAVVRAMIQAVASTRTVQESETSRLSDTGQPIQIVVTMAPLFDELGALVGVSSSARDITERRRLEDQLRRSESLFRSAFDGALLGMCLTGLDGRLVRVNQVFATMMGRSTTALIGMHSDELTHPDHPDDYGTRFQLAARGESDGFRGEKCYLDADGAAVWADLATSVIRNAAGAPEHLVTQLVDITQRRAALRERDARDAMLAAVIANSQSLIYVKDLLGRYLLANEPLQRMFGVSEAELLGQTDRRIDRGDRPDWRENDVQARQGAFHLEECFEVGGSLRYFESVKFPLFDADGRLYATCGIALDVTDRRQAALAVSKARDEAVAATAAKSAFLATMSHEIRTPMNAVIGMSALLLDTDLDATQQEYAETVRSSGNALLAVINDVLDYSKIESGKLELELLPFDVEDLVEGAAELIGLQAGAKHLDVIADIDAACPPCLVGDVTRLRQVLVNLLSNAVKFTAVGDVTIRARVVETADGLQFDVAVADTGIGIPPERMDRLFQSFSQVDSSTTRTYGGTGLGLAISARLVEAMGGRIRVESEPGRSSTFSFAIPTSVRPPSERPSQPRLPGLHVLVVDDNANSRRVLQRQLLGWGATSDAAGDSTSALLLAAGGRHYDVALLDIDMDVGTESPPTDGSGLAVALRARSSNTSLPIVFLSSYAGRVDEGGGASPFTAGLVRPAKSAQLHRAIVGAINGQSPSADPIEGSGSSVAKSTLRVLLAEDNAVNQRVALLMLDRLGYRADVASNGIEAIAALRTAPYDVVLMDVQMPQMDGLEATRRIRMELPAERQPVIIAMTANAMAEDRAQCLLAGMDDYLSKPFRKDGLAEALARSAAHPPRVRPPAADAAFDAAP